MNDPPVDLGALRRTPKATADPPSAGRRWRWRLVPLAVLIAFFGLLGYHLRGLLTRAVPVTVERPRALDAAAQVASAAAGSALFQAAGWAEPEPFPFQVSALRPGVVAELLVVPADRVEVGQVVARLVHEDVEIALGKARAALDEAIAKAQHKRTEWELAEETFEEALQVTETLRVAEAQHAGRVAARELAEQAVIQGDARLRIAEDEFVVQQDLADRGAAGVRQLDLARARVDEAKGALAELRADVALAAAEVAAAEARLTHAQREADIRLEDRWPRELAREALAVAESSVVVARAEVEEAELAWRRSEVRSPAAGFVLALAALPGSVVAGEAGGPLLTLYDPAHLRMRVDVLADDIAKVHVGQRAEVLTDARPDRPYAGIVLRVVEMADIQKKTIQVHVAIEEGDALLKPDLLGQVRFFASGDGSADATTSSGSTTVLVPARLVENSSVWIVRDGCAHRQSVTLGGSRGELVEITAGIDLSAKLIDDGRERVAEGAPVEIREDPR